MLARRHKQLRKRAKRLAELSSLERHAMRIAAKKLRYTAEFFGSLFKGGKRQQFFRRFRKLQDELGVLNDLVTTRALMSELAERSNPGIQRALGLCTGWSAGLEEGSRTNLVRCWKEVERTAPFWPAPAHKAGNVGPEATSASS
jgi:CHAD domain-containing protein